MHTGGAGTQSIQCSGGERFEIRASPCRVHVSLADPTPTSPHHQKKSAAQQQVTPAGPPPHTNTSPLLCPRATAIIPVPSPTSRPPSVAPPKPLPFVPPPFSAARPSESRKNRRHGVGARRRSSARRLQGMTRRPSVPFPTSYVYASARSIC